MKKHPFSEAPPLTPALLVALITLAMLAPFLGKAFHIDDTLFLRAARQIIENPLDFYGFPVNWYGWEMRMSEVNQNPPLASYLIAAAASLFGWSETAMHTAFLLPAIAATTGVWRLASSFCRQPALAAISVAATPAFLVSSTNLMTDTTMVALFVWSLALWVKGLETNRWTPCLLASLLIAAATLTKYFAITAVPLLALLTITRTRRLDPRLVLLALPLAALYGFEKWSEALYGHGLFSSAAGYSSSYQQKTMADYGHKLLVGLSFTGGCLAVFGFFSPLLYSRRQLLAGGIGLAAIAAILMSLGAIGPFALTADNAPRWPIILQLSLFILAGAAILGQSLRDLLRQADGDSLFLCCWVIGAFVFTTFVNWTTNARTVLPLAPAVAILIARQLERRQPTGSPAAARQHLWPLIPALLLALAVAWADTSLANSQRTAARAIMAEFGKYPGTVWFQGHWGFQYYMEEAGARPVDFDRSRFQPGDLMVVPVNNTNVRQPPPGFALIKRIKEKPAGLFGSMERTALGAGFYADIWGPLPYSFGKPPDEEFLVFALGKPLVPPIQKAIPQTGQDSGR